MDDLIADFLVEAHEGLDVVDVELVNFEARPDDRGALDRIFRLVHTLKGTSGFLGLARLEAVAHAGETLLGRFRDGKLAVTAEAVSLVLQSVDRIKLILAGLAAQGAEPAGDDAVLIAALEAAAEGGPAPCEEPAAELGRPLRPGEVSLEALEAAFQSAPGPVFEDEPAEPPASALQHAAAAEDAVSAPQTIRVGVDVLEDMMTLVSELVLTRNQLLQVNRGRDDSAFSTPLQRLSTITSELQDSVMKTRMQPIGAAWKKLPRLVRDLALELGKTIELSMDGEGTELDRQVLELIRDPLTHMVRNSADHGLETPQERLAAGKGEAGLIRLSAFHEGGSIVIRLSDDGRGLNTARIRDKAVEKGVLGRAEADALTESQAHRLIFAPGFSTASAITNVSGRGVGMDVVRSNVEQIGGQIELQSTLGRGSTFTIKIPLTLAIVSALIVGVGGERFAVPQGAVLELIKVGERGAEHRIETIDRVRMVRLREDLVPLIELGAELERPAGAPPRFAMIMQVGAHRFGVMVDEVIDTEEIVVKPLAATLRGIPLFSGATILGDGSVVLIVDPNGLAERAGSIPAAANAAEREEGQWMAVAEDERVSLLVVCAGSGAPKAVPLSRVTRLEHARAEQIERFDGRANLHYRGRLMPILQVDYGQAVREAGVQPLLVFTGEHYSMGLAVDEIVDVIDAPLRIELSPNRQGVLGVALVGGRATDILDLDHFMLMALAEHVRSAKAGEAGDPALEAA